MPRAERTSRPEKPKQPWEQNSKVFDANAGMSDMTQLTAIERTHQRLHREKDKYGRSVHAVKATRTPGSDGLTSAQRNLKKLNAPGSDGLTLAQHGAYASHSKKTEDGKSQRVVEQNKVWHREKDEHGRSKHTMKALHTPGPDGTTPTERSLAVIQRQRELNSQSELDKEFNRLNEAAGDIIDLNPPSPKAGPSRS